MAIKGILFNTDMVRAILDGRKTVTRRVIKPQPIYKERSGFSWKGAVYGTSLPPTLEGAAYNFHCTCPYQPGDILYVRETWAKGGYRSDGKDWKYYYRADENNPLLIKWHPSIHMPKEAARIWLKVTDVRVEQLRDIDTNGIEAEGTNCENLYILNGEEKRYAFSQLWDSTIEKKDIDKYGWAANPWVWVIEFERTVKPECI